MKAFPSNEPIYGDNIVGVKENKGMDLRDYFAAKALQGLISSIGEWSSGYPEAVDFSESVSHDAYWIADRMMEAREKK